VEFVKCEKNQSNKHTNKK